ncbi:MAG: metallophosphoesterase [Chromatiales bacterium]|nr:metallophosphoesterase [Chromatiales bacterium]
MRRTLVVVTVYYLIFGYGQLAAAWIVFPGWRPGTAALLALLVGPAAGWLVHQARRNAWTRWLQRAVYLWVGLAFVLLCVVVPVHLLLLLGLPDGVARGLLVAAWVALALWSIVNAHRIEVRRIELASPKLDRPVRLVQVSDVHVGSRGPGFLPRIVRRVNRLEPDAVLVTGDLIDLMKLPDDALDSVGALGAPAFFAIGNHERYIGSDAVCARLEALGVTVLRNACTQWGTMRIVGIDDAEARDHVAGELERIVSGTSAGAGGRDSIGSRAESGERSRLPFTVLMYHRPDGAEDAARGGVDLMLCGHTHNGQIVPFNWIVRRQFPRIAGRFDIDGMVLYVSPGTGTWGPTMRLGSSNEITVFDLSPVPIRAP